MVSTFANRQMEFMIERSQTWEIGHLSRLRHLAHDVGQIGQLGVGRVLDSTLDREFLKNTPHAIDLFNICGRDLCNERALMGQAEDEALLLELPQCLAEGTATDV